MAKSPTTEAEDGIVTTDDFIAVIDGSTSKSALRLTPNASNGRFCMTLIAEYLRQADKGMTCGEFCSGVSAYVRSHYPDGLLPRLAEHPEDRATASCVVYSRARREVWMVGDCQCLVDNALYENLKPCEAAIAGKRAEAAKRMMDEGKATITSLRHDDTARKSILADLVASMAGQNVEYAVIDGFAIPTEKVRIIPVPNETKNITLASDGYPFLKPTLAESELALQAQLRSDPLNIGCFKATKGFMEGSNSFDDRAYIRFEP